MKETIQLQYGGTPMTMETSIFEVPNNPIVYCLRDSLNIIIVTDSHLERQFFQNFGLSHLEHPETPHLEYHEISCNIRKTKHFFLGAKPW